MTAASPIGIVTPLPVRASIPWYRRLYTLVLAAIVLGALLGYFFPDFAQRLRPLGDVFIRLIRMMIEPIIFTTVVVGVGRMGSMNEVAVVVDFIEQLSQGLFAVIRLIMVFAPLGALGAMAFTIGKYGLGTLHQLGLLLAGVYGTCLLFIFVVLQIVARLGGFSLWRFLVYIREEILIVLGTSTSESALPRLMVKLEELGCSKSVVGLVVPTGYSFNLDGTSIYLSMAALFIAQAAHVTLSWGQQLEILGVLLLTSKGSAAVTGGGFVALAATLSTMHTLPVAGLALVFGVDRFMSEARALTNLIGNGVATIIVAKWERALDERRMHALLERPR
jgi:aerobic C4-dicarboxylate transport protein